MVRLPTIPYERVPADLVRWRTERPALARAERLEEPGPAARWIVAVVVLTLLVGLGWAATTRVPVTVTVPGTVLPAADIARIAAPRPGVLRVLSVAPGRLVEAGATLARIVPDGPPPELVTIRAELAAHEADAVALVTRIEGGAGDVVAATATAAAGRRRHAEAEQALALLTAEATALAEQEELVTAQVRERADRAAKGLVSRSLLLEIRRELSRIRGRRAEVAQRMLVAQRTSAAAAAAVIDLETRAATAVQAARRTAQAELAEVMADVEALRARVAAIESAATEVDLTAPVAGLVRAVAEPEGRRLTAGDMVAEILPLDAVVRADIRVPVADFAGVYVGQSVSLRVVAYDRPGAALVPGIIERVSPLAFDGGRGRGPYYNARVLLQRSHAGDDPTRDLIVAGMAVNCEIVFGERTPLARLLSPSRY